MSRNLWNYSTLYKAIPDFEDYIINANGHIISFKSGNQRQDKPHTLKPIKQPLGYYRCGLRRDGKQYHRFLHRLVLETFVSKCPDGMECRHLDGNKLNNKLSNLKWGTRSENVLDKHKHGTENYSCGENHYKTKLTEQDVRMIIYMWSTKEFSQKEIMKMYSICRATVYNITHKKTWKSIWKGVNK